MIDDEIKRYETERERLQRLALLVGIDANLSTPALRRALGVRFDDD